MSRSLRDDKESGLALLDDKVSVCESVIFKDK